jgi:hypothetical protein
MMHQTFDHLPEPETVDVDGVLDRNGIRYLGTARRQPNGKYVCLADVAGALCWVEVTLTFGAQPQTDSATAKEK